MKITITLYDKITKVRGTTPPVEWFSDDEDPEYRIVFEFEDNNYSCDCNRCLLLYRDALEQDFNKDEFNCTTNRIIVEKITECDTGKIIYSEQLKQEIQNLPNGSLKKMSKKDIKSLKPPMEAKGTS